MHPFYVLRFTNEIGNSLRLITSCIKNNQIWPAANVLKKSGSILRLIVQIPSLYFNRKKEKDVSISKRCLKIFPVTYFLQFSYILNTIFIQGCSNLDIFNQQMFLHFHNLDKLFSQLCKQKSKFSSSTYVKKWENRVWPNSYGKTSFPHEQRKQNRQLLLCFFLNMKMIATRTCNIYIVGTYNKASEKRLSAFFGPYLYPKA